MVDLIEFPMNKVAPDSFPRPGDKYEAYGLAHKIDPVSLVVILPDWSRKFFSYDDMGMASFGYLGDPGEDDRECVYTLTFGRRRLSPGSGDMRPLQPGEGTIIVITGRRLLALFDQVSRHRVHWIWQRPQGGAIAEGSPVVHSIEIKDAGSRSLAAPVNG